MKLLLLLLPISAFIVNATSLNKDRDADIDSGRNLPPEASCDVTVTDKSSNISICTPSPLGPFTKRARASRAVSWVYLGVHKQHIGLRDTQAGQWLWDRVFGCLKERCNDEGEKGECKIDDRCRIDRIDYMDKKGRMAQNAHLLVWLEKADFVHPSHVHDMLRYAAGVFAASSEIPENCHERSVSNEPRKVVLCNVGHVVRVDWKQDRTLGTQERSQIIVRLRFNGPTTHGKFDCEASMIAAEKYFNTQISIGIATYPCCADPQRPNPDCDRNLWEFVP